MQEIQLPSLGWEDPLEEEMAAHSSILAGILPWPWGCKESDTTEHTHTTHCTGLSQTIVDIANIYWGFLGSTIFCQAHLMCRLTLYNIPKK